MGRLIQVNALDRDRVSQWHPEIGLESVVLKLDVLFTVILGDRFHCLDNLRRNNLNFIL